MLPCWDSDSGPPYFPDSSNSLAQPPLLPPSISSLTSIQTTLNYYQPRCQSSSTSSSTRDIQPYEIILPQPHTPLTNLSLAPNSVCISNARCTDYLADFKLETHGFQWLKHSTSANIHEAVDIQKVYLPEVERIVRNLLDGKNGTRRGGIRMVKAWDCQVPLFHRSYEL
jgi:hypothetical protein